MSNYIHGSDPDEQARLSTLNELINSRCLALLNLKDGEHVLDVGSGLGQFTLAMGEKVGNSGKCLGIERDEKQLSTALRDHQYKSKSWVEFRKGDAENLELKEKEWGSFDLAHARFILEHVRQPEAVVETMTRAVRSGGKVVLEDDDHELMRLYPLPEGFSELWQAYMRSYDRLGNDPFIGRKLVTLLYNAGLINIRNDVVFFGDSAGSPTFQDYAKNLVGILTGARELILDQSLLDAKHFDAAVQHIVAWSQRPDAALWYTINWAEGFKT